jgi:type II secretory pathway component PulF
LRLSKWYRNFLEDLRTLLHAGIPVRNALETLAAGKAGQAARLAGRLLGSIEEGCTLAEALKKCPREVLPQHAAILEAGECTGTLDSVLRRLVERLDQERVIALEFLKDVAWPVFLAVAAVVLLPVYLLFTGEDSLYITIQVVFFSIGGLLAACLSGRIPVLPPGSRRRAVVESLLLRTPWVREAFLEAVLGRAFGLLGILIEVGGSLEDSFRLAAGSVTWDGIRQDLLSVPRGLRRGRSLHEAVANAGRIPLKQEWVARILMGETAGTLDKSFQELGAELEERFLARIQRLAKVLPGLIVILVGVLVLYRALGVYGSLGERP